MTVLAEVVDESIKGMEAALVSKAEQEKVCQPSRIGSSYQDLLRLRVGFGWDVTEAVVEDPVLQDSGVVPNMSSANSVGTLHPESRLRSPQSRTPVTRKERSHPNEGGE